MAVPPEGPRGVTDYRVLPEPVAFEDMITSQDADAAPDPTLGRDIETEFMLHSAAG